MGDGFQRRQIRPAAEQQYRDAFLDFVHSFEWHWMVTIGIGGCPTDEELLRRLRIIEGQLCGKYLSNSYHKLDFVSRYSMLVGFEGERARGTRHAHILVHVPVPTKNRSSHAIGIDYFDWDFLTRWMKLSSGDKARQAVDFKRVGVTSGTVKDYYAVKSVSSQEVAWSDVQFVTPPKSIKFENANTNKIHNQDRRARLSLRRSKLAA